MGGDNEELTRRKVLTLLVGAGGALAAIACGNSEGLEGSGQVASGLDAGLDAGGAGAGDAGDDCRVTPEGEVGPYFADDSASGFNRSNILSNLDGSNTQAGVPLALTITVLDTQKSCSPYVGAQIDIWHCNADGVYSDISSEHTSSEQWLRGYQLTDGNGQVKFQTIVPGWYAGRTTHIHLRVRSSYADDSATNDGTNTTQLFFAQAFIDSLDTGATPYSSEGQNPTANANDRVYSEQENGANLLALSGNATSGYVAAVTLYLPITTEYDDGSTDGGMTMGGGPGDGGRGGPPGI